MDKIFKNMTVLLSYLLIITTILLIFLIPPYIKADKSLDFFSADKIAQNIKNLELNETSIVYVKNSKGKWVEYQRLHGNENRIWVNLEKIPENLKNAFIAIEDQDFRTHNGVDWKRTIGAVGNFLFDYSDVEFGGSTITQQLIKNVTLDNDRNANRKFREIVRAVLVEDRLDKDEILEAYLNTIALGNGICGVQVAANYYFNKDVEQLTLIECATLAAITKNPLKYNPLTGMDENKKRRNTVLDKMLELGFIKEKEYNAAYDKTVKIDTSQETTYEAEVNNYFMDTLIEQVISDLAKKYECEESIASSMLYNGGYKIYATLDTSIQAKMEKVYLDKEKYFNLMGTDFKNNPVNVQSAMTIMDYSGHIVGIVGGVGKKTVNRGLNRATSLPRQPGSTMKPIGVYAPAIENNLIHYSSRINDAPIDNYYPDGTKGPKEWYGYYKGPITVDYAIRKSANTIPVILLKELGINKSYDFVKNKLNCSYITPADKNLSALALGGTTYGLTTTESAAAYAIFGNSGLFYKPTTYYKIKKSDGTVELEADTKGKRVISSATSTIMNHLLQGVVYGSEGTGSGISRYNYEMKAFAKTGTSSESNDLWMVAGTPYYVGSVWYGFDKQQEIKSTSGAATVWNDVMKEIHKDLAVKEFVDSKDVYQKGRGYYKNGTNPDNVVYYSSSKEDNKETSSSSSTSSKPNTSSNTTTSNSNSSNTSTNSSSVSSTKPNSSNTNTSSDVSSSSSSSITSSDNTTSNNSKPNDSSNQKPDKPSDTSSESSSSQVSKPTNSSEETTTSSEQSKPDTPEDNTSSSPPVSSDNQSVESQIPSIPTPGIDSSENTSAN